MTFHPIARRTPTLGAVALSALCLCGTAQAQGLDYIRGLLDATPAGGWVKASTNLFSDARATGLDGLPAVGFTSQQSVVQAWSSMAWDSNRGNLLLWGGGHSSYMGNEMYVWNGGNGAWGRGSLPSRIESLPNAVDARTRLIVDDAAPQSAHTYEGNLFLPVNDMFMTLGGPVFQDAGNFKVRDANGNLVTAGPWLWDPRKADANKVGGTTGSGYNPATLGGEMWTNRGGQWANVAGLTHFLSNSTEYRQENGQDAVYLTVKNGSVPHLWRYLPGDVRGGSSNESWTLVGIPSYTAVSTESSGTIDNLHNLFVNTAAYQNDNGLQDLNVFDLSKAGPQNLEVAVDLVMADGSPFTASIYLGIEYAAADGGIWMWDGRDRGTLYRTEAAYNADGSIATTWSVTRLPSTTAAQPDGNHAHGVLGKWQYIDDLGVFVALDEYSAATTDAAVWFYKPLVSAVPEPGTVAMLLAGLGLLGRKLRRQPQQG